MTIPDQNSADARCDFKYSIRHARQAMLAAGVLVPVAIGSALLLPSLDLSSLGINQLTSGSSSPVINSSSGIAIGGDNVGQVTIRPDAHIATLGNALNDLTEGPGPNNDLVGAAGAINNRPVTLNREQIKVLIQILQDAERRLDQTDDHTAQQLQSGSAGSVATARVAVTDAASAVVPAPQLKAAVSTAVTPVTAMRDPPPTRLAGALPLLFAFVGTTSLIVMLMVYAGIALVRVGAAAGGAKVDILGMKVDAKGTGVAAIACGALVLVATYRPLIDAVVKISGE
jgi:hypothetical protein